jgi:hypothetical protein
MCIFAQPVIAVNTTKIFARATSRQTQFLAYQMNYESRAENAMILPVPIRQPSHDGSLRFVDLQGYASFFDDLANGFPYKPPSFNFGCSAPFDAASGSALEVFEVANYIASFVPRLSGFSRLDQRFTLPEDTWSQIPQYADFGFAEFQLAAGALKPHPMAFEFQANQDNSMCGGLFADRAYCRCPSSAAGSMPRDPPCYAGWARSVTMPATTIPASFSRLGPRPTSMICGDFSTAGGCHLRAVRAR